MDISIFHLFSDNWNIFLFCSVNKEMVFITVQGASINTRYHLLCGCTLLHSLPNNNIYSCSWSIQLCTNKKVKRWRLSELLDLRYLYGVSMDDTDNQIWVIKQLLRWFCQPPDRWQYKWFDLFQYTIQLCNAFLKSIISR